MEEHVNMYLGVRWFIHKGS